MRRPLLLTLTLGAACALLAGGASASPPGPGLSQKRGAQSKPRRNPASKPVAKEPAKELAKPRVKEIDEAGLKAILDENVTSGRRLLINFWATWCTPCREEFPDLVRMDEEFAGEKDFEFITISLDELSEIDKSVPQFLAEMKAATIPAYLVNAKDPENVIALVYGEWRGDLPATFLFGRGGELLFKHTGRVRAEELRAAIMASGAAAPQPTGGVR